jgi:beta-glucosidase/6-phospho-beta-glucosidase/beta-galactosidase
MSLVPILLALLSSVGMDRRTGQPDARGDVARLAEHESDVSMPVAATSAGESWSNATRMSDLLGSPRLDRRAFLKNGALALSSAALWACERDLPLAPRGPEPPEREEAPFFFASGIENSYPLLPNGRRIDEMEKTGHYRRWLDDFALAKELGLSALRYGPAYYRTNPAAGRYDWSSVDDQMAWLRSSGMTVIADLCHFGVPSWLAGFQDVAFPGQFAAYAREFAKRYPWVRYYTPINEIYVAATFSAWFGWWNEGLTSEQAFAKALRNLCLAHELAVLAILAERPDAVFVQAESIEHYTPADDSSDTARQAAFWNEVRYTALDLTLGRLPSPTSLDLLRRSGTSDSDLAFFRRRRAPGQRWLGVDYYVTCEQIVYADGTRAPAPRRAGLGALAREYHRRYGIPLLVSETNRVDMLAVEWLDEQWRETQLLQRAGVPVKGFTWYPLIDVVDWRYALRIERNDVDPIGLCDLSRVVRPVGRAYAALIASSEPVLAVHRTEPWALARLPATSHNAKGP